MFYFGIKTIPVREHLPPSKAGKTYQWCLYQVAALQQVLSLLTLHLPEVTTPASALVGISGSALSDIISRPVCPVNT